MENDRFRLRAIDQLKCEDVEHLLDPYLDGELGESLIRSFESHLNGCPSCKSLVLDCREIIHIARELDSQPLPSGVSERLRQALNEEIGTVVFKQKPVLSLIKND